MSERWQHPHRPPWDRKHHHRAERLFVFFFRNSEGIPHQHPFDVFDEHNQLIAKGVIHFMTPIQAPPGAVSQLLANDPNGVSIIVLEADDSGTNFFPPAGPLQLEVSDPGSTVTQGVAADGVTPTLKPNGSNAVGDVSVKVTDSGNNLVGTATLSIVAPPPPPPAATQLGAFFVPIAPAASTDGTGGASTSASPAVSPAAAAAPQPNAAGQVITDPHHNIKP